MSAGVAADSGGEPMGADDVDGRWMTYSELADARGIDRQSARRMANRTGWRRQKDNQGVVRVYVPLGRDAPHRRERDTSADLPADMSADVTADISHAIRALEASIISLTARAEFAEKRADQVEMARDVERNRANQAEQALSAERNRADQAKIALDRLESKLEAEKIARAEAEADAAEMRSLVNEAEARAERSLAAAKEALTTAEEAQQRVEVQASELAVAEHDARVAQQAAAELRRSNNARAGQGRWARLRAAWRGE
jgi:hypothetical protein